MSVPVTVTTLAISQRSTRAWSLDDDLAFLEAEGLEALGVEFAKLEATGDPLGAARRLAGSGLRITSLVAPGPFTLDRPERWPDERERAGRLMDIALALQPDVLVLSSGAAGALAWERAADNLAEILQGTVLEAEREGLALALAPSPAWRRDLGFVSTLRDAVEVGWRIGLGACLDVTTCWSERNLVGTIGAATDRIALVRVADRALYPSPGGPTHDDPSAAVAELVPGDGELPLDRVVNQLLDAGYLGTFELAAAGDHVEAGGDTAALTRGLTHLAGLIEGPSEPPD